MPLSHLTDQNATASRSRVETVREGLAGPAVDRPIWIRAARSRIQELERHDLLFGLETFEKQELAELEQLLNPAVAAICITGD